MYTQTDIKTTCNHFTLIKMGVAIDLTDADIIIKMFDPWTINRLTTLFRRNKKE